MHPVGGLCKACLTLQANRAIVCKVLFTSQRKTMRHTLTPTSQQSLYVSKIIAGLLTISLVVYCAYGLPTLELATTQRNAAIATLIGLALALIPAVSWVYRRRDELQRLQHQQASVSTVAVLASVAAVVGILQANQWVPMFNQFWTLGLLLVIWGAQLMWADRRFR